MHFFSDIKKLSIDLEKSTFSDFFCKKSLIQNLSREIVMENQETVMGKSVKNPGNSFCKVSGNLVVKMYFPNTIAQIFKSNGSFCR